MGRIYKRFLSAPSLFRCRKCATHLCPISAAAIASRKFKGVTGRAYLIRKDFTVNLTSLFSQRRQEQMTTGMHEIEDVFCAELQC